MMQMKDLTNHLVKQSDGKLLAQLYINQTMERLEELMGTTSRTRVTRSIDSIGSAWKWLAGSPDATDWNNILHSQNQVIENSNHQYKVNERLFSATKEVLGKIKELVDRVNSVAKESEAKFFQQSALHNTVLLREEVNEIIRACQLAKRGIVNTNLLDMDEINQILSEMETLPYQNIIEAIEYGKPSIYTNGTLLLYVLSMPKVKTERYNFLVTRAGIYEGKQLDLPFSKMLINQEETYGLTNDCLVIGSSTVCGSESLEKLEENGCLPRLLKGGDASCQFSRSNDTLVELVNENTVFVSNFQGEVKSGNASYAINGTYVIQLNNETIKVGTQEFHSSEAITAQALPAALANVKNHTMRINLEYVYDITMKNVEYLGYVNEKINFSLITEALSICAIIFITVMLWRCYTRKFDLPPVQITTQWIKSPNTSRISIGRSAPELHCLSDNPPIMTCKTNLDPMATEGSNHFLRSIVDLRDADL